MFRSYASFVSLTLLLFCYLCLHQAKAQCPEFYDDSGAPSPNPNWLYCFGADFTLNLISDDTIGSYTVDWGDGSPIDAGASIVPPAFISHTYNQAVDIYTLTFTETSSGCVIVGTVTLEEATSASIQIPIGGLTQACAPANLEFINSSTNTSTNTTFIWDYGDGSPVEIYDHTNQGQTVSHTYEVGTVDCETMVTLTAFNSCNVAQGGPSTATFDPIRIWDIDDAAIGASNTLLCFPEATVIFENTSERNCFDQGNTFQRYEYWNFGDYWGLGYDSIIDWRPWPPTLPYSITYPGLGTYQVMMIDSNFCGRDTAYIQVEIVLPPTADFSPSALTVCEGEAITFTNNSSGDANFFDWNFGDGSGWQTLAGNPTYTYGSSGTFTVQLVAGVAGALGCTDTTEVDVDVLPGPTAVINLDDSLGCDSLMVTFTDGSIGASQWAWDFGNSETSSLPNPPIQNYDAIGTYDVSLVVTAANSCTDTAWKQIVVSESPVVDFSVTNLCQNREASFSDLSVPSAGDSIVSWLWDFGDLNSSTDQNPTHTYNNTGDYSVQLTVNTLANCPNSTIQLITVDTTPTADFSASLTEGCTPLPVEFTNNSLNANSFNWSFGDGSTSTQFDTTYTYTNPGDADSIYTVTLIASNAYGCEDTTDMNITVFPAINGDFSHDALPSCSPLTVNFTSNAPDAVSYEWDFDDGSGSTLPNPSHIFSNQSLFIEVYQVQLVVTSANGCTDTSYQDVTIYPEPDFGFNIVPDSGCSPLTVTFPSVIGAVDYRWDFGDGDTAVGPTPTHTFSNPTTNDIVYTVQLIATSPFSCTDTSYGEVVVLPNPQSEFTTSVINGCAPLSVALENNSTGAVNFFWDYGDGTTSDTADAVHNHTFSNATLAPIDYTIVLVVETEDGCLDTSQQQVQVFPEVTALFTPEASGCSPLDVSFTNQSVNGVTFQWDFGDGFNDVAPSPTHQFINEGPNDTVFTTSMIAISSFGCRDTAFGDIEVYAVPDAQFLATPLLQTFPNSTVELDNQSSTGNWGYAWTYGDGVGTSSLQEPGDYAYATWGEYDIELIVFSPFCADTFSQSIIIEPPVPIADFVGSGQGCAPLTIAFQDASQYNDTYEWHFGDGNTSNLENPTYTYFEPGTYTVRLTVTGEGGSDTELRTDSVVVYQRARAFFTTIPQDGVVFIPSQPVNFLNQSTAANIYYWDFGDGNTSSQESPQHFYEEEGAYDVMLVANNEFNCVDTFDLKDAIMAEVGGEVNFPNAFTPSQNGPNGGNYDRYDGTNDVFFPFHSGVNDYHLMIFNRWGELIFESRDINVGWDGYYRGELCKQDVYVWKLNATLSNGYQLVKAGDVTLLR